LQENEWNWNHVKQDKTQKNKYYILSLMWDKKIKRVTTRDVEGERERGSKSMGQEIVIVEVNMIKVHYTHAWKCHKETLLNN
jgi:hypothetical protein